MYILKARTSAFIFSAAMLAASLAGPAQANFFHEPSMGITRHLGSAPNPTPFDLRGVYPIDAQAMKEQGQVELKLSLSEKGMVKDAVVEKSSGVARLDDAAVKYMKTYWSYEPPVGEDMPTQMLFTVNFVLR